MAEKLLKGRLKKDADKWTQKFTASHEFDRKLYKEDIALSQAYLKMLHKINILSSKDLSILSSSLADIEKKISNNKLRWQDGLEDVHMHIEAELIKSCGNLGKKLHTGRSRNDQVATDMRLYCRTAIDDITGLMLRLRLKIANKALEEADNLMPGFTHLQAAQPISCGHHLLAWHEMLARDQERFSDCRKRVNKMPLGSAALAGSSFPLDRDYLADELKFDAPMENSLDAVSSRDFIIEILSCCAISMQHLSRWAEEVVLWNSSQFGFIELDDHLCTGSSIMPQKKNPDIPELVRAKTGRVFGNLLSILVVMKAQALAYNKDNQEDKEALFDSLASMKDCLNAWIMIIDGMRFNHARMLESLKMGYVNATRLADYLVQKGEAFRNAYAQVGSLVAIAQKKHKLLEELSVAEMQAISPLIEEDVYEILEYKNIVSSYDHLGGTAPKRVKAAAKKAIRQINQQLAKA